MTQTVQETEKKEQHIVKGTVIKGAFPVEGNGLYCSIRSDSYGRQIGKVINDGEMFEVLRTDCYNPDTDKFDGIAVVGMCVLVTRKNSRHRGWYVEGRQDKNGKWRPLPDHLCSESWAVLETKGAPPDDLDESF